MRMATLLFVGNGVLAGHVLHTLSHGTRYQKIVVAARNPEKSIRWVNMLRKKALNLGYDLNILIEKIGIDDIESSSNFLSIVAPDVIFNTATMQSWWVITKLPDHIYDKVAEARFGPWLPMHLSPMLKLMQAVRSANIKAIVVNAAFPDAVNPVLARNGLGPALGIGNIANVVPALRIAVAEQLNVAARDVEVRICGHHFVSYRLSRLGHPDGAPVVFRASVNGRDVTKELDQSTVFSSLAGRHRRTGGIEGQPVTASSAVAVLEALQGHDETLVHAPGPDGLPGGYPVKLSKANCSISLPMGVSLDEAIRVNEEGQFHDGIERIDLDGTIYFAEKQMNVMKNLFGYECRKLLIDDVHSFASELNERYHRYLENNRIGN